MINFVNIKKLVVKSTMFPHRNIHKYTWTSPDGKTDSQIDHILIDRIWHSSVLDVRSLWGADCDTDHYLGVTILRETVAESKQAAQTFDGERLKLTKLKQLEIRKQDQIEIADMFAALENLNDTRT